MNQTELENNDDSSAIGKIEVTSSSAGKRDFSIIFILKIMIQRANNDYFLNIFFKNFDQTDQDKL